MECKSDFRNPLGFFECWITEDNLLSIYNSFIDKYENYGGSLDKEGGFFYSHNPETGEVEIDNLTDLFQIHITDLLFEKCQESKRRIDDYYSENQQNQVHLKNYINDKVRDKIKNICKKKSLFERFPILLKPLDGIILHVNSQYPNFSISENLTIGAEEKIPKEFDLSEKTTTQRIEIVLEFLNRPARNGMRFLSEDDYDILVKSIENLAQGITVRLSRKIVISNIKSNNTLNYILRLILYPYIQSQSFSLAQLRDFLKANVDIYSEKMIDGELTSTKSDTFYGGTLKVPNIKNLTLEASFVEWWIEKYST